MFHPCLYIGNRRDATRKAVPAVGQVAAVVVEQRAGDPLLDHGDDDHHGFHHGDQHRLDQVGQA